MNEQDQQTASAGRSISILAYGNTADELELYALDRAREFFGSDIRLEVERTYSVQDAAGGPNGEKYMSTVRVRTMD